MPKHRFLTVYDYGTGGVWQWVSAASESQIIDKYPALVVVREIPDWILKGSPFPVREYDIEDAPDKVMMNFTKKTNSDPNA